MTTRKLHAKYIENWKNNKQRVVKHYGTECFDGQGKFGDNKHSNREKKTNL